MRFCGAECELCTGTELAQLRCSLCCCCTPWVFQFMPFFFLTFTVKKLFLVFKWNFLHFGLYPLPLVMSLDTSEEHLFVF